MLDTNKLFSDNYDRVYCYVFSMMKNRFDAEDVTQNAFIQMYNHIDNYNSSLSFINWAIRIAHNVAIDFKRKSDHYDNCLLNFGNNLGVINNNVQMNRAQSPYLGKYRIVYELRFNDCLSIKEISSITEIPMGTILWMINKMKKEYKRNRKRKYSGKK